MKRDLRPLFAPRTVAVVGASADPSKWGNVLARGALRGARRRTVFLVNRAGGEILGEPAYTSLGDLPVAPELAVLCVPAAGFAQVADEALAIGTRAIVGITSGLGEHDEQGRQVEAAVAERVRAAGAVLLGPNCLGVFDAGEKLDLGWSELPPGPVALVSQSGNLALELARLATASGLGFSRFASLGNQADLVAADFLDELATHEPSRVIALYLEDFRDGRAFVDAARGAVDRGTRVLLLSGGVSRAGGRAAFSHTGALVSDPRAIEAACRAGGIVRVETPRQLVDAAQALLSGRFPRGRRVAVYADGGGHGIIAGDVLAAAGFEVPGLSEATTTALREHLPHTASVANPIDFAGGGERGLVSYADAGRLLLASPDVDSVLLTGYFGGYGIDTPELADEEVEAARALSAAAREGDGALVVHTAYADSPAAAELRRGSVPVYADIESAVAALDLLAEEAKRERPSPDVVTVGRLDPPAPGYAGTRAFLAAAGVPMAEARTATTSDEALAVAAELGFPVVLKATDHVHKSDVGGVILGISDEEMLTRAFADLTSRLGAAELSVERMAPVERGVELIVGAKRDPRFGPVVLAGLGGLYAELFDDAAVALAPIGEEDAVQLIRSLRSAPLLDGARGRPPLDVRAAARAVAAVSRAAACPAVSELEVNPLLVLSEGVLGLDARLLLSS
ncbi:MAG: acetate--CoA ligase family protein [Actinobacteria bacterium]|nr:MAG: acetate--CoA ligase family protein [Actinomycetota bacterium]